MERHRQPTATSPVYAGADAVSFSITSAWGGFYTKTSTPLSTTGLTSLSFAMQASAAGQSYTVGVVNSAGTIIGNGVPLANVGGNPVTGSWKVYDIPLGATGLNVDGQTLGGLYIQDLKGTTQPVAYLDEIGFKGAASSTPTPTPVSTATPTPVGTATPTPVSGDK